MAIVNPTPQDLIEAQLKAAQLTKAAVPQVNPPVLARPGAVPLSPDLAGVSPIAVPASIQNPAAGLAGDDTILGMTPEQFQSVMGGIGQALAPPDTWQSRLGAFAKQIGQGQIVGDLTGQDVTGSDIKPKAPVKAKKSKLDEIAALPSTLDLSETLLGGK